ncbi:hypothetical protein lerEdw1_001474 [Lerista edwardsae]|nr:hypothetical protein lerEdw1_001474 [Lerista edwardsae]
MQKWWGILVSIGCVPQESQGFVLGKYLCLCKPGFYGVSKAFSSSSSSSNGQSGESTSQYGAVDSGNFLECRPCQEGCTTCVDSTPCLIQEDWSLRAAILAFQAFCMLAVFLSMLVSYHFRKSKRIRASGIVLLETILFGSLLLYFPVFILYFKPSIFRCIVLRWVRMLGFAIVYGTITLKLYRVLKVFLSRTAQRVPYMTSGRVLKMLALILLLVLWFLAAWTVGMLENIEKNIPLVVRSQTTRGLQFYICDHDRWDYMMVVAEMLFLFWGSFLCYATRTVPSAFHEPRYMGIALHNELITSAAFHVVRFLMVPSLHPDWTLLLFFIHTHITTTMTLALLFIPKFLHAGTPLREEIAAEVYEDELDLRRSGSYLNSSITSAWSEHSLDPDDIRDELKKLYTQLEVHKTKKMTANNPHLQKKRSSKRGFGRSFMRRITEIPESMSRQCSREEKGGLVGGGSRSRSSSYQRRRLDSSSSSMKQKDDSSSKPTAASSLKKSHSTYDHMADAKENSLPARHDSCKEAPLLDSMMRRKLAKKASERSNSDSLDDSAPLVYKSASAHNLMADKKPLHPRPPPLQKSLSVVTSAKEKALLLTSRAYLEESSKQMRGEERRAAAEASVRESEVSGQAEGNGGASEVAVEPLQRDDASEGTVSSFLEEGSSGKDTVGPCEAVTAPSTPSETRSQKRVTTTPPIRSVSLSTSDVPKKRQQIGKKTPPEPPVRQQSLVHSFERRGVVSGEAEAQTQPPAQSPQRDSTNMPMLVNICPWETEDSPVKTELERTRQTEDGVPHSSPAGLNRLASIAAEVCPWEVMEVPVSSKKDPHGSDSESQKSSPEKQPQSPQISPPKSSIKSLSMAIKAFNRSRMKTSIKARKEGEGSPGKNEKDKNTSGKPKLAEVASMFLRGSQVTARSPGEGKARVVSKQATVCPWDEEEEEVLPSPQRNSPSKSLEICPWEMSQDDLVQSRASSPETMPCKGEVSSTHLERTKSQWESTCPWETTNAGPNEEKTSNVPLVVSKTDSRKTEVCPWEVAEDTVNTQREMSRALSGDETVKEGKGIPSDGYKKWTSSRETLSTETQATVSGHHDSRDIKIKKSRWENAAAEESSIKIPDPSKIVLKTSSRVESKKVDVCPWETEVGDVSSPEVTASSLEKRRTQVSGEPSKDVILKTVQPLKMPEEKIQHDSICPWEGTESEGSLVKPSTKSLDPSKTSSKKPDSFQNKRAAITPWETEEAEPDMKTAICPWESKDTPAPKGALEKGASVVFREGEKETRETALEKGSDKGKGPICLSDSAGSKDWSIKPKPKSPDLSKGGSKKSDSMESRKAAVCPWEAEDTEGDAKADICPWERTQAPSDKRSSPKDTGGAPERTGGIRAIPPEKVTSPRDSICPLENDDLLSGSSAKSPGLSKVGSPKSHSIESLKAEACPWESQEAELSTRQAPESPLGKTPSPKGGWTLERQPPLKQTGLHMERVSSSRESVCPWESADYTESSTKPEVYRIPLKKSDSVESSTAEVCPWEVTEGPAKKSILRKEDSRSTAPMSYSQSMEKLSRSREQICPWESVELEEPSAGYGGQRPALSKAGSKKTDSAESLRAEICPWETAEQEGSSSEEASPLSAVMAPFEKGKVKQELLEASKGKKGKALPSPGSNKSGGEVAFKKVEKSKSHQESVLPWGSMDFDKPPAKSTRSLDLLQVSSKKSESAESLKAEICPWEFQELQTRDKTELCPWEGAKGPLERGTLRRDKGRSSEEETSTSPTERLKSAEKVSSSRESICPWESMELLSSSTSDLSKAGSKKSDSIESLRAEVCPWETEEAFLDSSIEMYSRKPAQVPVRKVIPRQEGSGTSKAQTRTKPGGKKAGKEKAPKTTEKTRSNQELVSRPKSTNELSEKLSSRSLDFSKVGTNKSDSVESLRAEVCPWEIQELTGSAQVCPWEVAEALSEKGTSRKDAGEVSKGPMKAFSKALEKDSSFRESLCPWESATTADILKTSNSASASSKRSDSAESRKADICPWEVDLPQASAEEEICPWQVGTVLPIKTEKLATHSSSTEAPKGGGKRSESKLEGLAGHKPLCRILPDSTRSRGLSKGSSPLADTSAKSRGDRCPWEVEEDPTTTRKDSADISKAFSAVCPWEEEDPSPTSVTPGKSKAGEKPEAGHAKGPSQAKSDICPWDCD